MPTNTRSKTAASEAPAKPAAEAAGDDDGRRIVIASLKKTWSSKHIKRLKKGKGKLMGKVDDLIDSLDDRGALRAGSDVLVVVVREDDFA